MAILCASHLKKYYGRDESLVKALDDVSVSVESGQFVAVIGTSGSGKSTLLNMLGGLDTPTSGSVCVDGQELSGMGKNELAIFRRRKIGFIFQNYNLMPNLTVYENIVLPVELDGRSVDQEYLATIAGTLGLEDKLSRKPNKLSGGQQQRVAIARALSNEPLLILADEPTGNLDSKSSNAVIEAFLFAKEQFGATVLMVTHDAIAASYADRVIALSDGMIVKELARQKEQRQFMNDILEFLKIVEVGQ